MLKLKRVDIHGFKSFYDRMEMRFHGSGVAAIVGPNGCGKSNISDAISWVLGEQSAKSLRGARMEDVIFAGTRERKPLGLAQVSLTMIDPTASLRLPGQQEPAAEPLAETEPPAGEPLVEAVNGHVNGHTNGHVNGHANGQGKAQGHAHPKQEEITITRRLFRSGESEYLINGRAARLRDIQDLFSGTGLGPESYAIIEQGRIGQILSNKPADRRAIIEEAAGIGKYKTRKRLAEAKLESSKQNLARVFDILEEVGRQVNSLKRQASKARRYEELRTEMLGHLRQAVAARFHMLEREASKLALDLNQAQASFQQTAAEVQEKELEHTRVQEASYQREAELTAARARLAELNLEAERTRGRLESQATQIGAIDQRLAAGEAETQELDTRVERERQELETHARNMQELEIVGTAARERMEAKTTERDALQTDLRAREQGLEEARSRVLRLLGEASALRNQLAQTEEYLAAIERDAARSRREEETSTADLARLEQIKTELSGRLSARQLELESLTDRRGRLESEIKERQTRMVTARHKLDETRGVLSRQRARKDSLEEILSHRAYTTESVKRLFTAIEHGQIEGFRPLGVMADFVEVTDPTWEKACELFLHEELEYVVVNDWKEAERGVELMRADADGRATFLVHGRGGDYQTNPSAEAPAGPDLSSEPGVAGRLKDSLRLTNGFAQAPEGLLPRLARCFLATDRAEAQRLSEMHPDCYFLLPDGASYHAHAVSGGRKTGGGPLALKRELRELTVHVEAREREVDTLAGEMEGLEQESARLGEELESLRHEQQAQEKDALALDHEQRKLAEETARAGSRLSVARLELDRLTREGQHSRALQEQNQALVAEKEQARFDQEKALELARGEFEQLQARAHVIGEEHAAVRAELAGLEERLRAERAAAARLETQIGQLGARREELSREMERLGVERARLLADNIELDRRAGELAASIVTGSAEVNRLAEEEVAGRAALARIEESLKALRIEAQAAQERRSAIELELVKKQAELKYLDETSHKELSVGAAEVAANSAGDGDGQQAELDESGVAEVEQRYQDVRAKIEALGPVNPQALEEFQEAQQRYDFLNTQRQDLLDSIRDTEKAIHDLDVESRRRFKEAYDLINENFRQMFRTLFGGGQGEMRLTDESNLAESGIDILASPPGKKLQNVALLSGGEKSLTAMALLMAIFRYAPSPFCILDEVDAPLDEPNIQRLTRLIREMSEETQFIVITHAKRTMESAAALYGVTMQEPGLSKLVSVRFDGPVAPVVPGREPAVAVAAV
ncbi:MAG TPA: chromosome segregation protein SMC [Bryobacteraceae bacterium]|nr:chromosome segregation protein SMC [Bryobacteraceae bacterium]